MVIISITGQLLKMQNNEISFIYQGVIDFLKDPECLYQQYAEKLHSKVRKEACVMRPFRDMKEEFTDQKLESIEKQIKKDKRNLK